MNDDCRTSLYGCQKNGDFDGGGLVSLEFPESVLGHLDSLGVLTPNQNPHFLRRQNPALAMLWLPFLGGLLLVASQLNVGRFGA